MPNGMPMTKNKINIASGKKVFFVSDHHFGLDAVKSSAEREMMFIKWLDKIKPQTQALFILGDLFDYWFEYKKAVPKGHVRVLGKLAEFTDDGIPVYFFTGNHDMWMRDYFSKELHIPIIRKPEIFEINKQYFLLGHGDGLGPGDKNYKRLKKLFTNPVARFFFRQLHPDIGLRLIKYFSQKNKLLSGEYDHVFHGEDKEWLYLYSKKYLKKNPHINYFIFGHRHLPLKMPLSNQSVYFNTGDWLNHFSYLEYDGNKMALKYLHNQSGTKE
jgi:UDP-2,3-diacylglucosamine hydrolase